MDLTNIRIIKKLPDCKATLEELRRGADLFLQEEIPELPMSVFRLFMDTGSRQEFEHLYFLRRKRLTTFGLLALMEPEEGRYDKALHEILDAVCDEYTWCLPAHFQDDTTIDLFAAETAFTLAEMLHLFGDRLPEQLRGRMERETFRRVLDPFIEGGPIWWERADHNWASVCAGSVGGAAIYLLKDEARLAVVLDRVHAAMNCYLGGFAEDGACAEGYAYWQYGFGYFVYYADLLKEHTKGEVDLFASEKVKRIALFQQKCFLAGRAVVNFSDSPSESGVFMGLTHYLKSLYGEVHIPDSSVRAEVGADHCGRWAPAVRNLLWLRDEQGSPWPAASYPLGQAQWLISRIAVGTGRFAFAAKGGHNDEPHNHNDVGQFILCAEETPLVLDLGSGQYTKEYFGPQRYEYVCTSSEGHSVPIVGGKTQREGRTFGAAVTELSVGSECDIFAVEMANAYELTELSSLVRTFVWNKKEARLRLRDDYVFEGRPASITERFIVSSRPECSGSGRLTVSEKEVSVSIAFDPDQLAWRAEPFRYLDHFGRDVERYRIDFTARSPSDRVSVNLTFALQGASIMDRRI